MRAALFRSENEHGLILYGHPSSPCARRVRITLIEKGLTWDTQMIDLSRLEQRRPEYLRLNPNGFVPTLAHGERVIYESNVITEYLDDVFPAVPLYPSDPWELAQVKMWQAAEAAMAKDYRALMYQRLMGPLVRLTRSLDEALAIARQSTSDAADLA
jgi:glutathione S-transferase